MSDYTVAGAGLVGCLQGIMLKRMRPKKSVSIYEKRTDPRRQTGPSGRSINLVVTSRGINALVHAGLWNKVRKICVPVVGRMIHQQNGDSLFQPYGRDSSECNYSVSRGELNNLLLDEAEKSGVEVIFERAIEDYDGNKSTLTVQCKDGSLQHVPCPILFGADGVHSAARKALVRNVPEASDSITPLDSGYKEFLMPANTLGTNDALHIWPRGNQMLMALPNRDGSFTMTLYLPSKAGPISFEHLTDQASIEDFFHRYYPDIMKLIPGLTQEFMSRPLGNLGTVKCSHWFYRNQIVLMGDAAHAIVPFFGQGMNCGFEDCVYLTKFFHSANGDWEKAFAQYDRFQRPNGDAIAEMALENYVEMREKVGNKQFILRKRVDLRLEKLFPRLYRTRYAMVVYTLIPYRLAQQAGEIHQEILDEICQNLTTPEQIDTQRAEKLIKKKLVPFLKANNLYNPNKIL